MAKKSKSRKYTKINWYINDIHKLVPPIHHFSLQSYQIIAMKIEDMIDYFCIYAYLSIGRLLKIIFFGILLKVFRRLLDIGVEKTNVTKSSNLKTVKEIPAGCTGTAASPGSVGCGRLLIGLSGLLVTPVF